MLLAQRVQGRGTLRELSRMRCLQGRERCVMRFALRRKRLGMLGRQGLVLRTPRRVCLAYRGSPLLVLRRFQCT